MTYKHCSGNESELRLNEVIGVNKCQINVNCFNFFLKIDWKSYKLSIDCECVAQKWNADTVKKL